MKLIKMIDIVSLTSLLFIFACTNEQPKSLEIYNPFKGTVKWDPGRFSPLPDSTPFELSMQLQKDILNGEKVLNMQLLLSNPTKDTVFLAAIGGAKKYYYNFIVIKPDSMRIWSRIQSTFRMTASLGITLKPGKTKRFQNYWDYTNYDGNTLEEGKYLIYGGIERLSLLAGRLGEKLIEFGDVGVGPAILIVKQDTTIIEQM
jgi:hypothetical protein